MVKHCRTLELIFPIQVFLILQFIYFHANNHHCSSLLQNNHLVQALFFLTLTSFNRLYKYSFNSLTSPSVSKKGEKKGREGIPGNKHRKTMSLKDSRVEANRQKWQAYYFSWSTVEYWFLIIASQVMSNFEPALYHHLSSKAPKRIFGKQQPYLSCFISG